MGTLEADAASPVTQAHRKHKTAAAFSVILFWVFRFVLSARIYAGFRTQSLENYYFSNIYTQSS